MEYEMEEEGLDEYAEMQPDRDMDEDGDIDADDVAKMGEGFNTNEFGFDEEDDTLEEDFDLSEILAELEEDENLYEAKKEKEEEDKKKKKKMMKEAEEAEEEEEEEESEDVADMSVEDLKALIKDIVAQEIGDEEGGKEAGEETEMGGEEESDEINLDELLAELDALGEGDDKEEMEEGIGDFVKKVGQGIKKAGTKFSAAAYGTTPEIIAKCKEEKAKGKIICGYGASTKGNTLLQWFGLDNTLIDAIAERSPYKFGLKTIGTNIPILSEEDVRAMNPDYMLVLPWHFINEFIEREHEFLSKGGKFIVPCPKFEIIKK
jgi:hypothetical protein